jgi:hypothetical protein
VLLLSVLVHFTAFTSTLYTWSFAGTVINFYVQLVSMISLNLYHLCSHDISLQAIGPELTFYNTSKDVGESPILPSQLLHAQLDAFCRSDPLLSAYHWLKLAIF